eukprot:3447688-Amphidinium_carterae.1
MTERPQEQVALEPEPDEVQQPPLIGENGNNEAQTVSSTSTVSSSSTGASTRLEGAERQESEDYWDNILEIMYEYFHDDNEIGETLSLHEG